MRILFSTLALAATLSVADAAVAQTPAGVGELIGGLARGLGAARQAPSTARPAPETPHDNGARRDEPETAPAISTAQVDHTAPAGASATRRAGFAPAEVTANITSGGPVSASSLGRACAGMISTAPNFAFTYTAGAAPLYMKVWSSTGGDTTLVVRNPNGAYGCNNDYSGLSPALRWDSPATGTYYIWVGSIDGPSPSVLTISESN